MRIMNSMTAVLVAVVMVSAGVLAVEEARAATVFVGTFPDSAPAPLISIPTDTFLVPVQISGASNLQNWQFDLLFDNPLHAWPCKHAAEVPSVDTGLRASVVVLVV